MISTAFLGCSRGFGAALVANYAEKHPSSEVYLASRRLEDLQAVASRTTLDAQIQPVDFSVPQSVDFWLEPLMSSGVQRIFYIAGGGPHGPFVQKAWKDHQWSLSVNFLTPARILHRVLQKPGSVKQLVFVGSAVADDQPDPLAASYAAGKHALRGLLESVLEEHPSVDLRLYRPGYMNTSMLPPAARPRLESPQVVAEPSQLATDFLSWADDPQGAAIRTPSATTC